MSTTNPSERIASASLVMRWSPEQIERAHSIVNDINEDIDNRNGRKELREALAIYADLLADEQERRSRNASEIMLEHVRALTQIAPDQATAIPKLRHHEKTSSPFPSPDLLGLCECGDKFPDASALMDHKLRHHMLEWPNVADAAKRLRANIEVQAAKYITVRSDDVETLLGFAENASDQATASE